MRTTKRILIIFTSVMLILLWPEYDYVKTSVPASGESAFAASALEEGDEEGEGGDVIDEPVTLPAIKRATAPKNARAAIAMDAVNGDVYCSKNSNTSIPVASVSKLMTMWLVLEKIGKGADPNKKIKINSTKIEKLSRSRICGGYVLRHDKYFTVNELIWLTMLQSSNAAATRLGVWVSGSNKAFIAKMNKEAKKLGLNNSTFSSASGLDNYDLKNFGLVVCGGKSGTNRMSAMDIAKLTRKLLEKHPEILKYSSAPSKKVKGKWIINTNRLLTVSSLKNSAKSLKIDGLKTGYTSWAGNCLATTGKPSKKHRIITVVLNDRNCFADTITLMKSVYAKNQERLADKPIVKPPVDPGSEDSNAATYINKSGITLPAG